MNSLIEQNRRTPPPKPGAYSPVLTWHSPAGRKALTDPLCPCPLLPLATKIAASFYRKQARPF